MLFWILCLVLAVVVTAMVLMPLLRGVAADDFAPDVAFYKAQLAELEREVAAGQITGAEAETTRIEISRRLLAADAMTEGAAASTGRPVLAGLSAATVLIAAFAAYSQLGAPGYGDFPLAERLSAAKQARANRPSQDAMQANALPAPAPEVSEEYLNTLAQLRQIVPNRPDDEQGWRLLAQHEGRMRDFIAASAAQAHLIGLLGEEAQVADRVFLLDMMVAAAGGFVSPEAEAVIAQILAQDPDNPAAAYYGGALYFQTDRADLAFRLWRPLVAEGDATTYHVAAARAQIENAAVLAGEVRYSLPPASGPSLQDIAAAQDLSSEDRAQMIAGMVQSLSDRLANEGGTAQDWARLITAHAVLGNSEQAQAVYVEALELFGASQTALDTVRNAAVRAGLTP